ISSRFCFFYGLVQVNRRKNLFDAFPAWLQPGWQFERLTQLFRRLVNGKTGRIGRQLEQHAARLTKIDGMEVAAIHHRCNVQVPVEDPLPPALLLIIVSPPPRDMMDSSHSAISVRGL